LPGSSRQVHQYLIQTVKYRQAALFLDKTDNLIAPQVYFASAAPALLQNRIQDLLKTWFVPGLFSQMFQVKIDRQWQARFFGAPGQQFTGKGEASSCFPEIFDKCFFWVGRLVIGILGGVETKSDGWFTLLKYSIYRPSSLWTQPFASSIFKTRQGHPHLIQGTYPPDEMPGMAYGTFVCFALNPS
jgi:hypothetical protein